LYDYAWFVGFGVAFGVHWALMKAAPPVGELTPEAEEAV
jgi:cytosine/uracil/thiamine/allantoin permease